MDICTTGYGSRYYVEILLVIKGRELTFAKSLLCARYFIHASPSILQLNIIFIERERNQGSQRLSKLGPKHKLVKQK